MELKWILLVILSLWMVQRYRLPSAVALPPTLPVPQEQQENEVDAMTTLIVDKRTQLEQKQLQYLHTEGPFIPSYLYDSIDMTNLALNTLHTKDVFDTLSK